MNRFTVHIETDKIPNGMSIHQFLDHVKNIAFYYRYNPYYRKSKLGLFLFYIQESYMVDVDVRDVENGLYCTVDLSEKISYDDPYKLTSDYLVKKYTCAGQHFDNKVHIIEDMNLDRNTQLWTIRALLNINNYNLN